MIALLNTSTADARGLPHTLLLAVSLLCAPFVLFYLAALVVALLDRK